MTNAVKAVEDGMSVASAARQYNVPRTTLQDRKLGNVFNGVRPGARPYLTQDEETKLAEYVIECASVDHRKARAEVMAIAENTARDRKMLRKQKITHGWYEKFMQRQSNLLLHRGNPSSISADFRKAGIHQSDKLRPTVEHEAEEDSGGCSHMSISLDSSTTHDDNTDVYKKRYEEGYDIFDEPYVRWLVINHPDDVRNDWMKKLKDSEKGT